MVALEGFRLQVRALLVRDLRATAYRLNPLKPVTRCLLSLAHERAETTVSRNLGVALCKRAFACRADLGRLPACRCVRALLAGAWGGRSLRLRHRRARGPDHVDGGARREGPAGGRRLLVGQHEG